MNDFEIDSYIRRLGGVGILKPSDVNSLNEAKQKLFVFMSDGRWHSRIEITRVTGQLEGTRRLRELRGLPGVEIERRSADGARRLFEYRMVMHHDPDLGSPEQRKLF